MNTYLVTGAGGWLGKSLIGTLARSKPDHPVHCLLLPDQPASEIEPLHPRIRLVRGDVRVPKDCQEFCEGAPGGILFHTAGVIHPRRVREFYEINASGTKNLVHAAESAGIRRIIAVSSNSPCGCNLHPDHLFDECSPFRPYMHYGHSKMLLEQTIQEAYVRRNIETVTIRAPWFYGPNQPARQTLFFSMIRDGKAPIVGDGMNLRSMAYLDNLSQGLILASDNPRANGQVYWIADKQPYSMNEIIDTIERLMEEEFGVPCAHRRLHLPWITSEIAMAADAVLQSLGVYHQKIHVLSEMNKTIACSIEKAETELGYRPAVALEEGMRRSLAEWLKRS